MRNAPFLFPVIEIRGSHPLPLRPPLARLGNLSSLQVVVVFTGNSNTGTHVIRSLLRCERGALIINYWIIPSCLLPTLADWLDRPCHTRSIFNKWTKSRPAQRRQGMDARGYPWQ